MDAHSDVHCPKGIVVIPMDLQCEQMVIIQNTVIDAFTGSSFFIDCFILFTTQWDLGRKPEIRINLKIDCTSIVALGTFRRAGGFFNIFLHSVASSKVRTLSNIQVVELDKRKNIIVVVLNLLIILMLSLNYSWAYRNAQYYKTLNQFSWKQSNYPQKWVNYPLWNSIQSFWTVKAH